MLSAPTAWIVVSTSSTRSSPPRTRMRSSWCSTGAHTPAVCSYSVPAPVPRRCSTRTSCTSPPRLVTPQATCALRPITTNGRPGSVNPLASRFPAATPAASTGAVVRSAISYHALGISRFRWASLASKGLPEAVRTPLTAQLFDPARQSWQALVLSRASLAASSSLVPAPESGGVAGPTRACDGSSGISSTACGAEMLRSPAAGGWSRQLPTGYKSGNRSAGKCRLSASRSIFCGNRVDIS